MSALDLHCKPGDKAVVVGDTNGGCSPSAELIGQRVILMRPLYRNGLVIWTITKALVVHADADHIDPFGKFVPAGSRIEVRAIADNVLRPLRGDTLLAFKKRGAKA